jgi:hypothetical protein
MEYITNLIVIFFILVLMLDPGGNILKIKLLLFVLLLGCCIVTFRFISKEIYLSFLFYAILIITSTIGFFANYDADTKAMIYFYKSFSMIWLLPWIAKIRIIEYLKFPALIISVIVIFIEVIMFKYPQLEYAVHAIMQSDRFLNTIMMGRRTILGIRVNAVYYTSAPVLLLLFAVMFQKYLTNYRHKIWNLIFTLIILCPLLMGGTRAMIASALAIAAFLLVIKFWNAKYGSLVAIYLGLIVIASGVFLAMLLLSDTKEISLSMKKQTNQLIYEKMTQQPEILIWGNGVGAIIDTGSVRGVDTIFENTYLEFIRWFGLPLTALLLLAVYIYPLYLLYKKRKILPYGIAISIGYVFYLLLAGTNPYLISSNGMLTLLAVYSYALNPYYKYKTL